MGVSVAVVGLGWMGWNECELYDELDGADLVAGVDVRADARDRFEETFDAPAFADPTAAYDAVDLDAMTIATPHALHYEQATAALERGLDVLVEKPMVTDLAEARSLRELADERDAVVQVGYYRQFHPAFRELRRLLDEGRIGRPRMVACSLGQGWLDANRDTWRTDADLAHGGQLYDSGSHLLDGLVWALDAEPTAVAGVMDPQGEPVDVNSALAATLDRDGESVTASIAICSESTGLTPDEITTVWGTEGRLTYRRDERQPGSAETLDVVEGDQTYTTSFELDDPFAVTRRKLAAFVEAVGETRESAVPADHGVALTAFREAAREAWETGRTVEIDPA